MEPQLSVAFACSAPAKLSIRSACALTNTLGTAKNRAAFGTFPAVSAVDHRLITAISADGTPRVAGSGAAAGDDAVVRAEDVPAVEA